MRSACSCGRSISYRADPFTLESANFEFYESLAEKCCATLTQHSAFGKEQLSWRLSNIGPSLVITCFLVISRFFESYISELVAV